MKKHDCAFCEIAKGKKQAYIVYEDNDFMCVLSRHPRTNGQCFLFPKQHIQNFSDAPEKAVQDFALTAQKITQTLKKKLGARGIDMLYTTGETEFPSVQHLALHLFPRYKNDNLNVWPELDTEEES